MHLNHQHREVPEAASHYQADIAEIRKTFVLRDDAAVTSFLRDHRTVPEMLLQAVPHLKKYFGPQTVFMLRMPVDESGAPDLYAVAMWPGKAHDAIKALDQFEANWWVANSGAATGYLNFTYELE